MTQGVELDAGDLANSILTRYLPLFVELRIPAGHAGADEDFKAVMHTRFPRFIGVFSERLPAPMRERLAGAGLEQLPMPARAGLGTMVAIPLDRHHGSLRPLMARAAALLSSLP